MTVNSDNQSSSLSTKVTVIVFWGLVVIGLVFASLFLQNKEEHTLEQREFLIDSIALQLMELQPNHSMPTRNMLTSFINRMTSAHPDASFGITIGDSIALSAGKTPEGIPVEKYQRFIPFGSENLAQRQAELVITFPSTEHLIFEDRKTILFGLGITLLIFGVILKGLLEGILTRPISLMTSTAKSISAGNIDLAFDETRTDEFGYLGKFINEAVKQLRESEQNAQHSRDLAEITLNSIADAVITTDHEGKITSINAVARDLLGIGSNIAHGKSVDSIFTLTDENTGKPINNPVYECIGQDLIIDLQQNVILIRIDSLTIPIDYSVAPIHHANGSVRGTVMVIHDMSVARSLQRELSYQASHDPLTGLYNRREFDRELQQLLDKSGRDGHEHTLCYLDLDQFKVVNDTCGHAAGDLLLQQLANYIQSSLRKADVLARLGGDEFGMLLYHCPTDIAVSVAEGIRDRINDFRFVWNNQSFQVGVSIGLAPLEANSLNSAEVLAAADMACYAAKEDGRNRIHVYRSDDKELHRRRSEMNMVSAVRKALADDNFELFAQPIVSVSEQQSIPHYEILIRMKDESGGYVPPGAFLPALERYQLIATMDRWVIKHSIDTLQKQLSLGKPLSLSINLSGQSINEDSFLNYIIEQVSRLGDQSHLLCFEITETAAIGNLDRAIRLIDALHSKGCYFALDDFGTGVSTFSYLKNLSVDFVKIDGAFVKQLHENRIDAVMVKSINDVALAMNIKTIAEFVENQHIHDILKDIGVHYGQGYWYAAPRPLTEIVAENHKDKTPALRAV